MPAWRRSSNWSRVPFVSLFSAKTTKLIFTKILHDIMALVALLNHAYARHYCIPFQSPQQRVKVIDFDVWRLLGYHKTYVTFVILIHVTTYAERQTKFGLVFAEIFGGYADFCQVVQNRCRSYSGNLRGYWTEWHQNSTQCTKIHFI